MPCLGKPGVFTSSMSDIRIRLLQIYSRNERDESVQVDFSAGDRLDPMLFLFRKVGLRKFI